MKDITSTQCFFFHFFIWRNIFSKPSGAYGRHFFGATKTVVTAASVVAIAAAAEVAAATMSGFGMGHEVA